MKRALCPQCGGPVIDAKADAAVTRRVVEQTMQSVKDLVD